jgi:SAM-dependent methyltransferase
VGCRIHGIDYSRKAINEANKNRNRNVTFEVGDIVKYKSRIRYDKALTIRCLINIMSRTEQQEALINIYELLKDRGIFIMAEAFSGGLKNLNKARNVFKLKPLAMPVFNNYFDEEDFEKFISKYFSIVEIKKYASLYYIGTRLFQYLALDEDPNKKDTPLHRFFVNYDYETKKSGDFSPQKIYVLQKK